MTELRQKQAEGSQVGTSANLAVYQDPMIKGKEEQWNAYGDIFKTVARSAPIAAAAYGQGKADDAAIRLTGSLKTKAEVGETVDKWADAKEQTVATEESESGDWVTQRRMKEVHDETLDRVELSNRGLQEAYDRGLLSWDEIRARAVVNFQRETNSIDGNYLRGDISSAMSKLLGGANTSPGSSFIKRNETLIEEGQKAAKVAQENKTAAEIAKVQALYPTLNETDAAGIVHAQAMSAHKAELAKTEATKNTIQAKTVLKGSAVVLGMRGAELSDMLRPFYGGEKIMSPEEKRQMDFMLQSWVDEERMRMQNAPSMTNTEMVLWENNAILWKKDRANLIEATSQGKVTEEQLKLLDNMAKLKAAEIFGTVYAMSMVNEPLGASMATMTPEQQNKMMKNLGINKDDMDGFKAMIVSMARVGGQQAGDPKPSAKQIREAQLGIGNMPYEQQGDITESMEANGADTARYYSQFKEASPDSLVTQGGGINPDGGQLSPAASKSVIYQMNGAVENIEKYKEREGVTGLIEIIDKKVGRQGRRTVDAVRLPANMDVAYKELIKRAHDINVNSPTLWQDDFGSAKEATEAMFNSNYKYSAEEYLGRLKKLPDLEGGSPRARAHMKPRYEIEPREESEFKGESGPVQKDIGRVVEEDVDKGTPLGTIESDIDKIMRDVFETGSADDEKLTKMLNDIGDIIHRDRSEGSGLPLTPGAISIAESAASTSDIQASMETPLPFPTVSKELNKTKLESSVNALQEDTASAVAEVAALTKEEGLSFVELIQSRENNKAYSKKDGGWDSTNNTWVPHTSLEKGTDTLAYGHKLTDTEEASGIVNINGVDVDVTQGITEEQAQELFFQDMKIHLEEAKTIPSFAGADVEKQKVIIDLVYNFGLTRLKASMPATYKAIKDGDWDKAAEELKWKDTKDHSKGFTAYYETNFNGKLTINRRAKSNISALKK